MKITVYLGPSMAMGVFSISSGMIYVGKATDEIEKKKECDPNFAALFVSPEQVAKERRGLQTGDTYLANCYQAVLSAYQQEKEGK
ncbi:hypothetical protein [Orbus mooreae]|uniref:hypothetical protein n=1 Tax=Orbus mooreae TaxID=3074107 RepID=UPI00370D30B6